MLAEEVDAICGVFESSSDTTGLTDLLDKAPHLVDLEVIKELAAAVRTEVRVDVRKALRLAEAALLVAERVGTDEALAFGKRAKANALWPIGKCKQATLLFDDAAALFERAGDKRELARTLSSSLQSLALLGEYDRAFASAEKAKSIFTSLGDGVRVARLDINVANIYHRQNRYAEALAAYERAYLLLVPHRDMEAIGVALHNTAVCLIALDDFPRALETYSRVRLFCEQNEMPLLVAQADYNIAFLYYLRGEYMKALELLHSTREKCSQTGDRYHMALCDLDRSEIYLELNLLKEASDMAERGLDEFEQLGMRFEVARSQTNLAIAVNAQGEPARALKLFARAREIVIGENNQVWPHLIDVYRAVVLMETGEITEARKLCQSAAEFFHNVQIPSKYVLCMLLLSRASMHIGEMQPAVLCCEEALRTLQTLDSPMLLYQAQLLRGQIYESYGQNENAYRFYQLARTSLETLRSSLQRDELKIGLMRNRLDVYSQLIQLCLARGLDECSAAEVLSYVEARKSRALRDLILGKSQPHDTPEAESAFDLQVRKLQTDLNWYYHRLEREQLSQEEVVLENLNALKEQARKTEHELVRLLLDAPPSASIPAAFRNSSGSTLDEIRRALGTEAALLEYFAIRDRMFVAVITRSTAKFIPLGLITPSVQRMRMLKFQLSKFRLDQEYVTCFQAALLKATRAHLQALYTDLLAPAESCLNVRDLIIVPDGPLHALPFHALYDGHNYLINRFTVSYAPSASIFVHSHRKMENVQGPSLIMGIDDPGMPYVREELESVAAVVPNPRLLFGSEATQEALREYGRTSRLIHIASHGQFRQDNPMFSSIRLADSYTNLYDLYHMDLPVDLLTLSGCVTGLNAVIEGDELLGLTRGLLYAGAQSLLVSLWDVDDRSTSDFMRDFYRQMKESPRKADALREAMIRLSDRYPHPYNWAPFKLIGRALA